MGKQSHRGLHILTVQGYGFRVFVPFFILESIFHNRKFQEQKSLPSDTFDLITGSSASGLLALLIAWKSRFSSIKKTLDQVSGLLPKNPPKTIKVKQQLKIAQQFSEILAQRFGSENTLDLEPSNLPENFYFPNTPPRVCVASSLNSASTILFRNYDTKTKGAYESCSDWRIVQSAQATGFCPGIFAPFVCIFSFLTFFLVEGMSLTDGSIKQCSTTQIAKAQVKELWPNEKIDLFLSLGCGLPATLDGINSPKNNLLKKIPDWIKELKTHLETIPERIHANSSENMPRDVYFRFNPRHTCFNDMSSAFSSQAMRLGDIQTAVQNLMDKPASRDALSIIQTKLLSSHSKYNKKKKNRRASTSTSSSGSNSSPSSQPRLSSEIPRKSLETTSTTSTTSPGGTPLNIPMNHPNIHQMTSQMTHQQYLQYLSIYAPNLVPQYTQKLQNQGIYVPPQQNISFFSPPMNQNQSLSSFQTSSPVLGPGLQLNQSLHQPFFPGNANLTIGTNQSGVPPDLFQSIQSLTTTISLLSTQISSLMSSIQYKFNSQGLTDELKATLSSSFQQLSFYQQDLNLLGQQLQLSKTLHTISTAITRVDSLCESVMTIRQSLLPSNDPLDKLLRQSISQLKAQANHVNQRISSVPSSESLVRLQERLHAENISPGILSGRNSQFHSLDSRSSSDSHTSSSPLSTSFDSRFSTIDSLGSSSSKLSVTSYPSILPSDDATAALVAAEFDTPPQISVDVGTIDTFTDVENSIDDFPASFGRSNLAKSVSLPVVPPHLPPKPKPKTNTLMTSAPPAHSNFNVTLLHPDRKSIFSIHLPKINETIKTHITTLKFNPSTFATIIPSSSALPTSLKFPITYPSPNMDEISLGSDPSQDPLHIIRLLLVLLDGLSRSIPLVDTVSYDSALFLPEDVSPCFEKNKDFFNHKALYKVMERFAQSVVTLASALRKIQVFKYFKSNTHHDTRSVPRYPRSLSKQLDTHLQCCIKDVNHVIRALNTIQSDKQHSTTSFVTAVTAFHTSIFTALTNVHLFYQFLNRTAITLQSIFSSELSRMLHLLLSLLSADFCPQIDDLLKWATSENRVTNKTLSDIRETVRIHQTTISSFQTRLSTFDNKNTNILVHPSNYIPTDLSTANSTSSISFDTLDEQRNSSHFTSGLHKISLALGDDPDDFSTINRNASTPQNILSVQTPVNAPGLSNYSLVENHKLFYPLAHEIINFIKHFVIEYRSIVSFIACDDEPSEINQCSNILTLCNTILCYVSEVCLEIDSSSVLS